MKLNYNFQELGYCQRLLSQCFLKISLLICTVHNFCHLLTICHVCYTQSSINFIKTYIQKRFSKASHSLLIKFCFSALAENELPFRIVCSRQMFYFQSIHIRHSLLPKVRELRRHVRRNQGSNGQHLFPVNKSNKEAWTCDNILGLKEMPHSKSRDDADK